jgi:hypothetical protein
MNYKLVGCKQEVFEGDFMFSVYDLIETTTGLLIKSSLKKEEAKILLRHLNMGGGFDGFTPAFFCNLIKN